MANKMEQAGKRARGAIFGCPKCGGFAVLDAGMLAAKIHCMSCNHTVVHNDCFDAVATWNGAVGQYAIFYVDDLEVDGEATYRRLSRNSDHAGRVRDSDTGRAGTDASANVPGKSQAPYDDPRD